MLDPLHNEGIEYRFKLLRPLITQMALLTAFLVRSLIDCEAIAFEELEHKFSAEGTSLGHEDFHWLLEKDNYSLAEEYNDNIHQQVLPGLSIIKTELAGDMPSNEDQLISQWWPKVTQTVQECFLEIKTSFDEFCPMYEVPEGGFPFSPESGKLTLSDGSIERTFNNIFVLTMDIIGSTDSIQTSEFKENIIDTFRRFKQPMVFFQETGDDKFVVCAEDPRILWDIANSVSIEGEKLREAGGHFGGTRKGLSFGTVQIIEKTDGSAIIKDTLIPPHLLPRACGILSGVDAYCNDRSLNRNLFIIMSDNCTEQIAKNLKRHPINQKPFKYHSKHFTGRCYIFDLDLGHTGTLSI